MKNRQFLAIVLLFSLFAGCVEPEEYDVDELNGVQLQSTYAIPLLKGSLTVKDLLTGQDSTSLGVREDDVLFFRYEQDFEVGDITSSIDIPTAGSSSSLTIPMDITVPANSEKDLFLVENQISLESDLQFREILYKAGTLKYTVTTNIGVPLRIKIEFPSISKDGVALSAAMSTDVAAEAEASLSGFSADLTTASPGYNHLPLTIKVTAVNNTPSEVTISQGETIQTVTDLSGQEFKEVYGFFGEIYADITEMNLQVGPFDELLKYDIDLAEMNLQMEVLNNYGLPLTLSFPEFSARNGEGAIMDIQTDPAGDILIQSPSAPGEDTKTVINITNGAEIIDHNPEEITYAANATLNKGQTDGDNFITDSGRLAFNLSAEIPLIGSFQNLVIQDTLDVGLGEDFEELEIINLELKAMLLNELPLGGNFQIFLLDEQQQITGTLLLESQTDIIKASSVTATGDLDQPGVFEDYITISPEKLDLLVNASQMIIQARLNTSAGPENDFPDVKFKSAYTLEIDLGMKAEIKTTIQP